MKLEAPLFWPNASRLIIDCNRAADASSLIVAESEGRPVPANRGLSEAERSRRLSNIHVPYHAAIDTCLARRMSSGRPTALISIHSFTPVYFGKVRPWQVGVLFDDDRRLADPLISGLKADPALTVGINQPYSPADGVYYMLRRHAQPQGLPSVMIEIRNDEISDEASQRSWAERLADILFAATPRLFESRHAMV